jgi:hypothetical protein
LRGRKISNDVFSIELHKLPWWLLFFNNRSNIDLFFVLCSRTVFVFWSHSVYIVCCREIPGYHWPIQLLKLPWWLLFFNIRRNIDLFFDLSCWTVFIIRSNRVHIVCCREIPVELNSIQLYELF